MTKSEKEYKLKKPVDEKNPTFYVNKVDFYNALVDYRKQVNQAQAEGKEKPRISNYIGECFMKIADGVGMKHRFRNYSYLDDMKSLAVETCVKYILSFDPEKSVEAFSYFTQCVWYAFFGFMAKERKQLEIKRKAFFEIDPEVFSTQDHDDGEFRISLNEYINSLGPEVEPKEEKKGKKSKDIPESILVFED